MLAHHRRRWASALVLLPLFVLFGAGRAAALPTCPAELQEHDHGAEAPAHHAGAGLCPGECHAVGDREPVELHASEERALPDPPAAEILLPVEAPRPPLHLQPHLLPYSLGPPRR